MVKTFIEYNVRATILIIIAFPKNLKKIKIKVSKDKYTVRIVCMYLHSQNSSCIDIYI